MAIVTLTAEITQRTTLKPCCFCGARFQRTFVDLGYPRCETLPAAALSGIVWTVTDILV